MSEQLPPWRMNSAGAILADTDSAHERFSMYRFSETPLFKACVLSSNWRAYKREQAGQDV